jgi:NAD(P)-dependent dehydrogenase (short-subunit alcohol dehydrogenase family)
VARGGHPPAAPTERSAKFSRTTQAMLPLLRAAPAARIVNVSSGWLAADELGPGLPRPLVLRPRLPASKTALNAMTLAMAIELEPAGIKVNAVSPDFTRTALNAYEGHCHLQLAVGSECP